MTTQSILQGSWSNGSTWHFIIANKLPEDAKQASTAVFGLAYQDNKLLLTKTYRGWEIPGGHIEDGEDIQTALKRELLEEAGIVQVTDMQLFGYTVCNNIKQDINKTTGKLYPKISYIPHYFVEFDNRLTQPTGEDCIDSGLFDWHATEIQSSKNLNKLTIAHTLYLGQQNN